MSSVEDCEMSRGVHPVRGPFQIGKAENYFLAASRQALVAATSHWPVHF